MQTESRCPFCGGEVVHDYFGESCRARCCKCGSTGPVTAAEHDAFHAFCHPAHICKGMVVVSVETATKSRDTLNFMFACGRDRTEANYTAISEITAAIDAARKE